MKLVLKFKDEVKLFTGDLAYDEIVDFVSKEFNVSPNSLQLSFTDEDNDDITILSDDDIEVMQAVFDGKEYVKINVQGESNPLAPQKEEKVGEVEEVEAIEDIKPEAEKEEIVEPKEEIVEPKEEIVEPKEEITQIFIEQVEQKPVQESKQINEERAQSNCHDWKKRKFEKMESYLNETVVRLVDQRIKALIPCLKEQIINQEHKKVQQVGIVHEGFECKACLLRPIIGVRYECPTCPEFSLCEACQAKIQHDHNLLKIKKIIPKKEQQEGRHGLGHCFRKIFGHGRHGGHHGLGRSSSSSREKCHRKGPHWFMRKCWGLSMMFGGKPEQYRDFVSENDQLRPRQTFKKFADLQNIPDQEFKQRFIDMRCQKLSFCFGKPAQEYKKFVEQNYQSRYRELVHLLKEKGEKSDEKKCWWGGKRFNFNESSPQKGRCPFKKEEIQLYSQKVQEVKKEEEEKAEKNSLSDSLLKEFQKESPEVNRQKGSIMLQMQQIFGKENTNQYFKFINANFKKDGANAIIQNWISHQSKLSK